MPSAPPACPPEPQAIVEQWQFGEHTVDSVEPRALVQQPTQLIACLAVIEPCHPVEPEAASAANDRGYFSGSSSRQSWASGPSGQAPRGAQAKRHPPRALAIAHGALAAIPAGLSPARRRGCRWTVRARGNGGASGIALLRPTLMSDFKP